jgi:hypothetical protein
MDLGARWEWLLATFVRGPWEWFLAQGLITQVCLGAVLLFLVVMIVGVIGSQAERGFESTGQVVGRRKRFRSKVECEHDFQPGDPAGFVCSKCGKVSGTG